MASRHTRPHTDAMVVWHPLPISSVAELMSHLTKLFTPFAGKYNLTIISFGQEITSSSSSSGTLELSDAYDTKLEPAPITPTDTAAFRVLSGSIQATHAKSVVPNLKKQDMIVAPYLAGGNTGKSHESCPLAAVFPLLCSIHLFHN